ncbi:hypothetical protein PYCCODRAFT_1422034 [Trametes coccinea BRFM310]|uniref:HIT-type domain-containing protein n=1 Tax=Trametes coccinea (strain BRFM310) TaxID=1353009 RepID=A0A1Y2J1G5_TRAC3|nr:hypothetical protein PYCCODRAFT_1422034 [Trametes coccinea BRFM310]
MASTTVMHLPRPSPKRASHTWPGTATVRSHFEDFLREIGADVESTHLCCRGTSPHPHGHSRHASTRSKETKAPSSSKAYDKASASPLGAARRPNIAVQTRPVHKRGRTMSSPRVSEITSPTLPIPPKSPALSSIDLENHDATATYTYFSSARNALLAFVGGTPVEERPSRAPTRTFFHDRVSASRSPDSSSTSSPPRSAMEHRSRTRSSARSISPAPSIDSLDTASSSEAPATPKTQSILAHELLPTLDDLERSSRFRVDSKCMHCHRTGSNFPSCAKCGERWCSRQCRLQGQRGAAHACHGRMATA